MADQVKIENEYYNVEETFPLFDTVAVTERLPSIHPTPPGWFSTFAAMGAANDIAFFNVRNKATCGRAYNNQDTRDQTAWGYLLRSVGVQFFAPPIASLLDADNYMHMQNNALWEAELPQHAALTLRINQDDYLKINVAMVNAGIGPTIGGWGQFGGQAIGSQHMVSGANTQGEPLLKNMWHFPEPIGIPRRASLSATIKFSEYGRQLLQVMPGPDSIYYRGPVWGQSLLINAFFGVKVVLVGQRLVQQRGELHA